MKKLSSRATQKQCFPARLPSKYQRRERDAPRRPPDHLRVRKCRAWGQRPRMWLPRQLKVLKGEFDSETIIQGCGPETEG